MTISTPSPLTLGDLRRAMAEESLNDFSDQFLIKCMKDAFKYARWNCSFSDEESEDLAGEAVTAFWDCLRDSAALAPSDFLNCTRFIEHLNQENDNLSVFLLDKLPENARLRGESCSVSSPPHLNLELVLSEHLNRIMCQQRLDAIEQQGSSPVLEGDNLLCHNRIFLQNRYPKFLRKYYHDALPAKAFFRGIMHNTMKYRPSDSNYSLFRTRGSGFSTISSDEVPDKGRNEASETIQDLLPSPTATPEKIVCLRNSIQLCMEELQAKDRECVRLYYDDHCDEVEIARLWSITPHAVACRLSRANRSLRNCLKKNGAVAE